MRGHGRAAIGAALLIAFAAAHGAAAERLAPWALVMGTPRYALGFKQFDYVNPAAPKGGLVRLSTEGSFDSLNFVPARGTTAAGLTLIYDSLMAPALDEVSTEYGLIAEAVRHPPDWSSVTFRLNAKARWHDGKPITVADVIWSFEALKQHNPGQAFYYRHVVKAEATVEREVTFVSTAPQPRAAANPGPAQCAAEALVDRQGRERKSARHQRGHAGNAVGRRAYRIKTVVPGRTIAYERVPDYWARICR